MSRTLQMDLTPSRRSKRLLQNGYYLQPSGEQVPSEFSSEDDDDNVSIHSNNSSIYSERLVHYTESQTPAFVHKRRRRKGIESSPRLGNILTLPTHSPAHKKSKRQITHAESSSRSTPNLAVSKRENTSATTSHHKHSITRETKTTIHSVKQSRARGESSSLVQLSSASTRQTAPSDTVVNENHNEIHESLMTRNQMQFNAIGSGDQRSTSGYIRGRETMMSTPISSNRNDEIFGERGDSNSHKINESRISNSQYSSVESDMDDDGLQIESYSSPVTMVFAKLVSLVLTIASWFGTCVGHICRTIYTSSMSIFVFDTWLLSRRTSPLFSKIIRAIILFLLVLFLLTSSYLVATRILGEDTGTLLLPVQSIVGLFHMLSQKVDSFSVYIFSGSNDEIVYRPESIVERAPTTQSASYPRSYPELEEALSKMEVHFADKLVQVKNEVNAIRLEQFNFNKKQLDDIQNFNKKQLDDFRNALSALEGKLQREINEQLGQSNDNVAEKLLLLKNEVSALRMNQSSTKADIDKLRVLLSDKSQMSVKINEFNTRLAAFDTRLNSLNNLMMKSVTDSDQHVGNTTYIKEIAKMQFIENFLKLIKTGEGSSDDRNSLHFLFIAWLQKQGFARIEEVDRNMKSLAVNNNLTMAVLEKKFALHLERIRQNSKRYSSTITLEKIVERPTVQSLDGSDQTNTEAQVREWIQHELAIYSADRIGQADHALETAGGYVVSTRCSESYQRKTALVSLFGIPIYYNVNTPRSVIQASTLPGECWSFKGSEGYIVISLSGAVQPTSFTLEHIPRELSPYGRIDSAPKDFTVLGLADSYDYTGVVLGKYRYEENGHVIQQFTVTSESLDYFTHIELRVTSNWGHPEYTCLYRFRVHGMRQGADMTLPY